MKYVICCIALLAAPALAFQNQRRPTLGPAEPSMRGPGTSQTANPRRLIRMKRVYIQRIDNNLNRVLTGDLAHVSWLKVVDKADQADAIIRGTCFTLPHLKRLHTEVYIMDRVTNQAIWQDVIRVPYNPPALPKAVDNAAAEILLHLRQSIRTAAYPQRNRY